MQLAKMMSGKKIVVFAVIVLAVVFLISIKNRSLHAQPDILWEKDRTSIIGNLYAENNKLYYGTLNGDYVAIDGQTGHEIWKREISNDETILKKPLVANGVIHLLSDKKTIYSLNLESGELVENNTQLEDIEKSDIEFHNHIQGWRLRNSTDHKRTDAIEFEDNKFYQEANFLYSVNKTTENTNWKKETGHIPYPPIIANGNLYYLKENFIFPGDSSWFSLHVVDVNTGTDIWNWRKSIKSGPIESEGLLYVMDDQNLYALR